MTALTFWLVFEAAVLGPHDTGLRLPTKQACQDIVDVIKAAALDAVPMDAPKFALVLVCAKVDPAGVPV